MKNYLLFFAALLPGIPAFTQQEELRFGSPDAAAPAVLTLSGRVLDQATGQPVLGAVVTANPGATADVSGADGAYSLRLPPGPYVLSVSYLGYADFTIGLQLYASAEYDIRLAETAVDLGTVTVTDSRADENVRSVLGSVEQLSIEQLDRKAKFLGETDVLRSLQSVTGVTSAGEGAAGFNVRGGNADENLILMDGNLVFNPVHALGFLSLFHPDMVREVTLFKGGVPARYGGRLSSVLDVRLREGDDRAFKAKGGVGIASSRLVLEGPIVREKASFIVGARASYVDWILQRTRNADLRKSKVFFYDLTAKADARLTKSTKVGFTAFRTGDDFRFADQVKFEYATTSGAAYLRQLIGDHVNLTATANLGRYRSNLFDINGNDQSRFTNQIGYLRTGLQLVAQPLPSLQLEAGTEQTRYQVAPGELEPLDSSVLVADRLPVEKGIETSPYLHVQWTPHEKVEAMAGIRRAGFRNIGPDDVFLYEPGTPRAVSTIRDTLRFAAGETVIRSAGWEPRFSLRISVAPDQSVKLGYNRAYQYLSQITNTASATPIDSWQLSNYHLPPQVSDNYYIGYYRNFRKNTIQAYTTFFYRTIDRLIDYKDFARLLLNEHVETELLTGNGKAYGIELYVNKAYGKHRLEMNYTWSRSLRRMEVSERQVTVNGGDWYPSNFDKPHSVNLNYFVQLSDKTNLSVNFTYSTGRPTTAPVSSFSNSNVLTIPVYSARNAYRIPDYHRLDLAYTVGPWGSRPRWRNSLTLSAYNLYFRKNAFSVFFRQNPFASVTAYRVAVLGTMFPAVTYNGDF